MCNSMVNVFSKHARFQDLGTIPSNAGDLQGWPAINDFFSIVNFHVGKFMSNYGVNVFSKQARFQDLRPISSNRGDL